MQEENIEIIDSPTNAEEVVTETTGTDTTSEEGVDVAKVLETNKRLFERAKKAEEALKAFKKEPVQQTQQTPPAAEVEEVVLRANGMSQELLSKLKDVAALKKTSLIDAQSDELFVAIKNTFEREQKSKAAALGTSRGSGQAKVEKTFATPGLSREEHKKMLQG